MTHNFDTDKTFLKTLKISMIDYTDKIENDVDIGVIKHKTKNDKAYRNMVIMIDFIIPWWRCDERLKTKTEASTRLVYKNMNMACCLLLIDKARAK